MLWNGVSAQSGCTTALTSLTPCLNYVTENSSTPSSSCCSPLAFVVQSTPICLCSLLNGTGPTFGMTINQTRALQLPGACSVKTPPVSQCNAPTSGPTPTAATPATSPAASPTVDSSKETHAESAPPAVSTIPSQGGSKALPSPPSSSFGVGCSMELSLLSYAFAG